MALRRGQCDGLQRCAPIGKEPGFDGRQPASADVRQPTEIEAGRALVPAQTPLEVVVVQEVGLERLVERRGGGEIFAFDHDCLILTSILFVIFVGRPNITLLSFFVYWTLETPVTFEPPHTKSLYISGCPSYSNLLI